MDRAFVVFVLIGMVNVATGIGFASFWSLFLQANLAFVVGYAMSLTISYLLNSAFAFQESLAWEKYLRFCLSYVPNFLIQNLIVFFVYNLAGGPKIAAYALAALLAVPITFLMIKFFAFRKKED